MEQAKELYLSGMKLIEIASQLKIPEGTVRSWKNRGKWDCNVAKEKKCNVAEKNNRDKKAVAKDVAQVIDNPELTDKQQLFCLYYVRCFNATKAYQKAYGADYFTAKAHGYELLRKVAVKKEIDQLKQNRMNRELLSEHDIFQKYMDIAFADMTDYVEFGREEVPVMGPSGPIVIKDEGTGEKVEVKRVVNRVYFRESTEVDGTLISEVRQGKDGASMKLADRLKALEWLSDHMSLATPEQKAKVEKLQAETKRLQRDSEADGGGSIVDDWISAVMENGEDMEDE